jgi:hypothetical protein
MKTGGVLLGILALLPGVAVGVTFAAGVNLYYDFHPVYFVGTAVALALTWTLSTASLRAFGVRRRLALTVPPAVAVAWTALFFPLVWHGYPDTASAARRHGVVLRTVPVYPGAQILRKETSGRGGSDEDMEEGFLNQPTDIQTTWTWRLPPRASTSAVADWYEVRLRQAGWRVNRDDAGAGNVFLVASKDELAFDDPRDAPLEVDVSAATSFRVGQRPPVSAPAEVRATAGN